MKILATFLSEFAIISVWFVFIGALLLLLKEFCDPPHHSFEIMISCRSGAAYSLWVDEHFSWSMLLFSLCKWMTFVLNSEPSRCAKDLLWRYLPIPSGSNAIVNSGFHSSNNSSGLYLYLLGNEITFILTKSVHNLVTCLLWKSSHLFPVAAWHYYSLFNHFFSLIQLFSK